MKATTVRTATPGAALLTPVAIASALLVAWNDLWLKRHAPGLVSGKLSDVGLCVFLPLFIAAALEWLGLLAGRRVRARSSACAIAAAYFTLIKVWPVATHAHVAWLSVLVPSWHFRATTDPTDLLCLPAMVIAWWTLDARRRAP